MYARNTPKRPSGFRTLTQFKRIAASALEVGCQDLSARKLHVRQ
jgi:hypothetical protein